MFPCKPKHVGAALLILKCFNNSTFFNVVCVSWTIKCWMSLMHGVTMRFNVQTLFIVTIICLQELGRFNSSNIDGLPSFPGTSTISFSSRFVFEGVFQKSVVVHSFKMVDPVLSVFCSHVLYSRDLQFFSYDIASYFVWSCVSFDTSYKAYLCSF